MELGICSYSFHRLLAAGKQDIFRYISDCKELGCTQLDPWNAHLAVIKQGDDAIKSAKNPHKAEKFLTEAEEDYLEKIEEAADASGLPWGTLAVDGPHIYEPTEEARNANRALAYRWIDVAGKLGFEQIRIDAGGPEEMPDDVFKIIVAGYKDLIARAKPLGLQVLIENHWGPSKIPSNVVKICTAVEGLGLLYDTHNWKEGLINEGRSKGLKFAAATHIKTFAFDAAGKETGGEKPEEAIKLLMNVGYKGVWGIESVPTDGDEYAGAKKTIEFIRKCIGEK